MEKQASFDEWVQNAGNYLKSPEGFSTLLGAGLGGGFGLLTKQHWLTTLLLTLTGGYAGNRTGAYMQRNQTPAVPGGAPKGPAQSEAANEMSQQAIRDEFDQEADDNRQADEEAKNAQPFNPAQVDEWDRQVTGAQTYDPLHRVRKDYNQAQQQAGMKTTYNYATAPMEERVVRHVADPDTVANIGLIGTSFTGIGTVPSLVGLTAPEAYEAWQRGKNNGELPGRTGYDQFRQAVTDPAMRYNQIADDRNAQIVAAKKKAAVSSPPPIRLGGPRAAEDGTI